MFKNRFHQFQTPKTNCSICSTNVYHTPDLKDDVLLSLRMLFYTLIEHAVLEPTCFTAITFYLLGIDARVLHIPIRTKLRHKFKASNKTTKITFNLDSQSTLCNGFLFYCNVLFIYYLFTKKLSTEPKLNQRPKDTCHYCNYSSPLY